MTGADVLHSLAERKYLRRLVQADSARPVVLIGSHARKTRVSASSDIDVLVLDTSAPESPPATVQVIAIPPSEFRKRASEGDDFAQWALRFGVPLSGRDQWDRLRRELLPGAPWPSPVPHRERATKRLQAATDLLEMGDLAAAEEEALFALSHVARADLLARGIFPLSRPELPDQLDAIGDTGLGEALRRAIEGGLGRDEIDESLDVVRGRLSASRPPAPRTDSRGLAERRSRSALRPR